MPSIVALANVNDTKRSAVDKLYTAFRSVVEGECAIISFGHGIGNTSFHSVVQPPLLSMTDAVIGRKPFPFKVIYGFIMADSPVVVRLSPSGNPFCL